MQLYGGERSPWVFHHLSSNRWADPGDRRKTFKDKLNDAIDDADLPEEFRPHDLRHRRCTRWLSQGHSPAKVRKAMGHSSLEITLQYEHLVRRDLEGMVEDEEPQELAEMRG
jgi:site-specific recombinase XerD